jgi:hypothetical protein
MVSFRCAGTADKYIDSQIQHGKFKMHSKMFAMNLSSTITPCNLYLLLDFVFYIQGPWYFPSTHLHPVFIASYLLDSYNQHTLSGWLCPKVGKLCHIFCYLRNESSILVFLNIIDM